MRIVFLIVAIMIIVAFAISVPSKRLTDGSDLSIVFLFFIAGTGAVLISLIEEYFKEKKPHNNKN